MMRQTFSRALTALLALIVLTIGGPSVAQNYRFSVPKLDFVVRVNPDASADLEYTILFENEGDPIDVVDIGLPHQRWDLSNMSAAVMGNHQNAVEFPLTEIRKSQYVDGAVEVHLGSQAIQSGQSAIFKFRCTMPDLVYQDTTRADYGVLRITPTWFDGSLVQGNTDLTVFIFPLAGAAPDQLLSSQERLYNQVVSLDGRNGAMWSLDGVALTQEHMVQLSFPKGGMERVVRMSKWTLLLKWWGENKELRLMSGVLCLILFLFVFFRFSGGTGCSLGIPMAIGGAVLMAALPAAGLLAWPALIGLLILVETSVHRRKGSYLPPVAQVEGGGIKRGLTAPEAAVILEQPLGKVLALVMVGLLKKGILRELRSDPLEVELAIRWDGSPKALRRMVAEEGLVVHSYEIPFLEVIRGSGVGVVRQMDFTAPMKEMVIHAASRLAGFDLSDTQDYYRHLIKRALREAESVGDVEKRQAVVDRNLEWLLLDDGSPGLFHTWGHGGYHYYPGWSHGGSYGGGSSSSAGGTSPGGRTSIGDVGASFAGWAEAQSGAFANAISVPGLDLPGGAGGVIDLSGADHVASEFLSAMAESSSSGGGGGGGGCACACAGCACACACAGGGR